VNIYANFKKSPIKRERSIVINISKNVCVFSEIVNFFSIKSTIFIAGKAMNTSITSEKTRVNTISNMIIVRNNYVQKLVLLLFEEKV